MAILDGLYTINNLEIMIFCDPKRWRATIWEKRAKSSTIAAQHVRTMHDKDRERLLGRVRDFATNYKHDG